MPKRAITIRIQESADGKVKELAKEHGVDQAVVLRAMLSVAVAVPAALDAKIRQLKADA